MNLSFILPILVFAVGAYLLIKLRFFFILHPMRCIRDFLSANRRPESRKALFLALAGTLGVGNIFGVAAGLIYGGAGTVFWLAVSSLFSAVLKYAECVLSFDSLTDRGGGMHLVLRKSFPRRGRCLSLLYAASCVLLALFMGGAMQVTAVSGAFAAISEKSVLTPSAIFAIFVFLGTLGGGDKIERITEKIIPLTMIVYIIMCLAAIFRCFSSFGDVVCTIISDAFTPKSAAFGIGGFLASKQFAEGFARGMLSNEAGAGTSSLAHTRSADRTSYVAGLAGLAEVVFDTTVLCMLTAVAILCSVDDVSAYSSPMLLVADTIGGTFGAFSKLLLLLSVATFAYSTVICWYYYGSVTSSYLLPKVGSRAFPIVFFAFLIFGGLIPARGLIEITDLLLLLLSVLTLAAILHSADKIKELTTL